MKAMHKLRLQKVLLHFPKTRNLKKNIDWDMENDRTYT